MARCPECGGPGGVMLLTSVSRCNLCDIRQRDGERVCTWTTVAVSDTPKHDERVIKVIGVGQRGKDVFLLELVTHMQPGEHGWWVHDLDLKHSPEEILESIGTGDDEEPGWVAATTDSVCDSTYISRNKVTDKLLRITKQ